MSYKELLYRRALEAIELIYNTSKYDSKTDLYRSFDIINSVNDNQIASKEWLVEKLLPYIDPNGKGICVLGGWYGLTGLMLRQHTNLEIDSIDSDFYCKKYGQLLTQDYNEKFYFVHSTAEDWIFQHPKKYQLIINTSVEHMEQEDVEIMVGLKRPEAVVCLQGNNYHEVQSHINTHNSLDEFVDSFGLKEVFYKEALPMSDGKWERYMVIGK
jgi:hypothetical protein